MPADRRPRARHLLALLQELRKAPSPLARARLLVRSAGALRRMSREERLRLVTAVGFDQAEELVDRMEDDGDTGLRRLLQDLLARLEAAGPERWAEMARAVREPEGRSRLLRQGIDLLAPPEAAEPEADAPDEDSADETPGAEPVEVSVAAPGAPPPPPGAPARPPAAAAPPGAPGPPAATTPSPEPAPGSEPAPERPTPVPVSPTVVAAPPVAVAAPPARPPRPAEPELEPGAAAEPAEPPAAPSSAGSVIRRLSMLRRGAADLEEAGPDRLRRLIEDFPAGWPRRRALMTLFRAGIPADLDAALELVASTQERPAARLFCLGALAARPGLGREASERLLAAAASGAERRRLALRLTRHRRPG